MRLLRSGQWAGWIGAALVAAAGGACLMGLQSTGFTPAVPTIDFPEFDADWVHAAVVRSEPTPGEPISDEDRRLANTPAAATLLQIRRASEQKDQAGIEAAQRALTDLFTEDAGLADSLMRRFEEDAFGDDRLEAYVLQSLLRTGDPVMGERAYIASARRESELYRPRGKDVVLNDLERTRDVEAISTISPEDLRDFDVLLAVESYAQRGPSPELRAAAIRALALAEDPSVTDFLLASLATETCAEVRAALTYSLGVRRESTAGDGLVALLGSIGESPEVRRLAASGLQSHAEAEGARRALLEIVVLDADPTVRTVAADTLGGYVSDPGVTQQLISVLQLDASPSVRAAAAGSLIGSDQPGARTALQDASEHDPSSTVRARADEALKIMLQLQDDCTDAQSPSGDGDSGCGESGDGSSSEQR